MSALTQAAFRIFSSVHKLANPRTLMPGEHPLTQTGSIFGAFTRTYIRENFPRPSERKRVKKLGWVARMQTPGGRQVLMRRILRGRYVYSH